MYYIALPEFPSTNTRSRYTVPSKFKYKRIVELVYCIFLTEFKNKQIHKNFISYKLKFC